MGNSETATTNVSIISGVREMSFLKLSLNQDKSVSEPPSHLEGGNSISVINETLVQHPSYKYHGKGSIRGYWPFVSPGYSGAPGSEVTWSPGTQALCCFLAN